MTYRAKVILARGMTNLMHAIGVVRLRGAGIYTADRRMGSLADRFDVDIRLIR